MNQDTQNANTSQHQDQSIHDQSQVQNNGANTNQVPSAMNIISTNSSSQLNLQTHIENVQRVQRTLGLNAGAETQAQNQTTTNNENRQNVIQNIQAILRTNQPSNPQNSNQEQNNNREHGEAQNPQERRQQLQQTRETNIQTLRQVQQESQQLLAAVNSQTSMIQNANQNQLAQEQTRSQPPNLSSTIPVEQYLSRLQGIRERYGGQQQALATDRVDSNAAQPSLYEEAKEVPAAQANNQAQSRRALPSQNIQALIRNHQRNLEQTRNNNQNQRSTHFLSESFAQDITEQYSTQQVQNLTRQNQSNNQQEPLAANLNSTNFTSMNISQSATQRNGQNGSSNAEWPPTDLYQQIDAMLQQTDINHQNANEEQRVHQNRNGQTSAVTQQQRNNGNENSQNIINTILRSNGTLNRGLVGQSLQSDNSLINGSPALAIQSQQLILDSIQNQNNQLQNNTNMSNSNAVNLAANQDNGLNDQGNIQVDLRGQNRRNNQDNANRDRLQNSHSTVNEQDINELFQGNSSQDDDSSSNSNSEINQSNNQDRLAQIALRQRAMGRQRNWQNDNEIPALMQESDSDDQNANLVSYGQANSNDRQVGLTQQTASRILGALNQNRRESEILNQLGHNNLNNSSDGIEDYNNISASSQDDDDTNPLNEDEDRDTNLNLRALGIGTSNQLQQQLNRISQLTGPHETSDQNRQERLNDYPLQDEIDDNDEVVSMTESLNLINSSSNNHQRQRNQYGSAQSYRLGDIGTIQSINARRLTEQNNIVSGSTQNMSSRRNRGEENKQSVNQNIDEIFKCFICFGKIQDAVLCPYCSKLCCRDCIKKWLIEQRQQCPHCRSALQVHQLVNCRFVEEITAAIDTLNQPNSDASNLADGTLLKNGAEVCAEHGAKLDYYCQTCKVPICCECCLFGGDKHKDHKFLRLAEVYDKHCDVIKKEAIGLKKRLRELTKYKQDVQVTIEKVTRAKEDKCKEIENFVENIQAKLNTQLKNKLLTLLSQRQSMEDEIEQLDEFHNKLNQELTKMPKSQLIKKSKDLIKQLKEIHTKEPHRFVNDEVSTHFTSELVPQYEKSVFVIKNFSRIRQSQNQTSEDNEIVYSDPPLETKSGLTWRLKVYPNGNGIAKGNYISVFLEMLKGLPESQTQKYEYRVEMINHRNPSSQVIREFASEFEVGECWGYNRFYRIDLLDREGYLNHEDDSITLKFFVRAPYYSQHCGDQERYIMSLQKAMENKDKELKQLQENYQEAQKKLKNVQRPKKLKHSSQKEDALNDNSFSAGEAIEENKQEEEGAQIDSFQHDSQKYLRDLKEKQKLNDQRMLQTQEKIKNIKMKKKAQPGAKADDAVIKNNFARDSPQIKEETHQQPNTTRAEIIQPRKSNPMQGPKFSINMALDHKQKQRKIQNDQKQENTQQQASENQLHAHIMNFEESDNDNKSEKSKGIEFYKKQESNANTSDDWNMVNQSSPNNQNGYPKQPSSNESSGSQGSNKLLQRFTNGQGQQIQPKQTQQRFHSVLENNGYNQDDHYEKVFHSQKQTQHAAVLSDNSSQDSGQIMGHVSDSSASEGINDEINSSANEEERKENRQYQMLKKSLKALQQRASTTIKNNTEAEQENQDLSKNYSVSSGNSQNLIDLKDGTEEQHRNMFMAALEVSPDKLVADSGGEHFTSLANVDHQSYIQSSFEAQDAQSINNQSYPLIDDSMDLLDQQLQQPEDIFRDEEATSNPIDQIKNKPLQIKAALPGVIKKRLFDNQVTQKQNQAQSARPGGIPEESKVEETTEGVSQQAQARIMEKQVSQATIAALNDKAQDKKKLSIAQQSTLQKKQQTDFKNQIQISQGKIIKKLSVSSSQKNIK